MSLIAEPDNLAVDLNVHKARRRSNRYYKRHRQEICDRRAYHCSCGFTFTGSGSWQCARVHSLHGHKITQGDRRVSWRLARKPADSKSAIDPQGGRG